MIKSIVVGVKSNVGSFTELRNLGGNSIASDLSEVRNIIDDRKSVEKISVASKESNEYIFRRGGSDRASLPNTSSLRLSHIFSSSLPNMLSGNVNLIGKKRPTLISSDPAISPKDNRCDTEKKAMLLHTKNKNSIARDEKIVTDDKKIMAGIEAYKKEENVDYRSMKELIEAAVSFFSTWTGNATNVTDLYGTLPEDFLNAVVNEENIKKLIDMENEAALKGPLNSVANIIAYLATPIRRPVAYLVASHQGSSAQLVPANIPLPTQNSLQKEVALISSSPF